jgi:hypothetical protein
LPASARAVATAAAWNADPEAGVEASKRRIDFLARMIEVAERIIPSAFPGCELAAGIDGITLSWSAHDEEVRLDPGSLELPTFVEGVPFRMILTRHDSTHTEAPLAMTLAVRTVAPDGVADPEPTIVLLVNEVGSGLRLELLTGDPAPRPPLVVLGEQLIRHGWRPDRGGLPGVQG